MADFEQRLIMGKDISVNPYNDTSSGTITALVTANESNIRLTGAVTNLQGIAGGFKGKVLLLTNVPNQTITIENNSAGAAAGNKIITGTGGSVSFLAGASVVFWYDDTSAVWRLESAGVTGAQGSQGAQGFQGVQGAQGAQGFQGFQGLQGAQGFQGQQGFQGFQGVSGAADTSQSIATANATTTLTNTSPTLTIFTGSATQIVQLPDTSTCTVGQIFKIYNKSSSAGAGTVTVSCATTGTVITSLSENQGGTWEVVSTATNTAAAWLQLGNNSEYIVSTFSGATTTVAGSGTPWATNASISIPAGTWTVIAEFNSLGAATATYIDLDITTGTTNAGVIGQDRILINTAASGYAAGFLQLTITTVTTQTYNFNTSSGTAAATTCYGQIAANRSK